MKKLIFILALAVSIAVAYAMVELDEDVQKTPTFEDAIAIIKEYEGLSGRRHWPFVGYGHKVMPGEKFTRGKVLSEAEADLLARKDYTKLCALYRDFGADSLLLAALAYNCGPGVVAKSRVLAKLKAGDRDIEASYLAHCRYKGRQLSQLKRRRAEELATLFVKNPAPLDSIIETGKILTEDEKANKTDSTVVYAAVNGADDGMRQSERK